MVYNLRASLTELRFVFVSMPEGINSSVCILVDNHIWSAKTYLYRVLHVLQLVRDKNDFYVYKAEEILKTEAQV